MITHKKDENGVLSVYYFDIKILEHGQDIQGSIQGKKAKGKLYISDVWLYFLQDTISGSAPGDKMGYKYGWCFKIDNTLKTTEDVTLDGSYFIDKNKSITKDNVLHYEELGSGVKIIKSSTVVFENGKINKENTLDLCKYKGHPDCCGSIILYNFDSTSEEAYSMYAKVNPESFVAVLKSLNLAPKLAHIAQYQTNTMEFLDKCGFKVLHEYKNPNSNRKIRMYQLEH